MLSLHFVIYSAPIFLLLLIKNSDAIIGDHTVGLDAVDNDFSIYYHPNANTTQNIESAEPSKQPIYPTKFISNGLPCSCGNLKCACCTGINITMIKFDRLVCANVTLVPEEFALDFQLLMNDEEIMTSTLTARNPPPACVPLYLLPAVSFCVRFFDLHLRENKFHACVDFETRITQLPIFILHFNCLKFGGDGVTWITKPSSSVDETLFASSTEPEFYDPVNFEIFDDGETHYPHTSTLTPEEEDQIGTLKI